MKIGNQYQLKLGLRDAGQIVTLIKVFPFNPRLPENYRVSYSNGAVVDVRGDQLFPVASTGSRRYTGENPGVATRPSDALRSASSPHVAAGWATDISPELQRYIDTYCGAVFDKLASEKTRSWINGERTRNMPPSKAPGPEPQVKTFDEFLAEHNITPAERVELVWRLAAMRMKRTIETLLVEPEIDIRKLGAR